MTARNGRPHGGARPGAGRKPSPLKNAKLAAELMARERKLYGDLSRPTPLEFILRVLWDAEQPFEVRLDAAKTALPFTAPRLSTVHVQNEDDNRVVIELRDFSRKPVVTAGEVVEQAIVALDDTLSRSN